MDDGVIRIDPRIVMRVAVTFYGAYLLAQLAIRAVSALEQIAFAQSHAADSQRMVANVIYGAAEPRND